MAELLYWMAAPGLVLSITGIVFVNLATNPLGGYVCTICAMIGFVMLAAHAVGSLFIGC